ncbi:MAG: hypothetical protein WAU69_03045 [Solirubrobacteraceae bacterium]
MEFDEVCRILDETGSVLVAKGMCLKAIARSLRNDSSMANRMGAAVCLCTSEEGLAAALAVDLSVIRRAVMTVGVDEEGTDHEG